jgi:hypothetical protein
LETYNGYFAAELVLDFARLDRVWSFIFDDLVEV